MKCRSLLALLLVVFGCDRNDPVRHYTVRKTANPVTTTDPGSPECILAAVVTRPAATWFFKISGKTHEIHPVRTPFETFVGSLRFSGDDVSWTLPPGWTKTASTGMRYATLKIPAGAGSLELSVTSLPSADLLANVNRWRGQLHLPPIPAEQLDASTKSLPLPDGSATLVWLEHPRSAPPEPHGSEPPISFDLPEGWKGLPAGGMRVAAFEIIRGAERAEITVIPLGVEAADLLPNVNRWRGQIGLPETDEAGLARDSGAIQVDGAEARIVDLTGPEVRILAVLAVRDSTAWFVKVTGPVGLVGAEKPRFEEFVRSLRFSRRGGGGGGR